MTDLQTPAFVYDVDTIAQRLAVLAPLRQQGRMLLYSLKAVPIPDLLRRIATQVDGFAVSSLFEARLGRELLGATSCVHLTTPGLRFEDIAELAPLCNRISVNSLSQWRELVPRLARRVSCGLRVNPGLALGIDTRYDPCRPHSKLGVGIEVLAAAWDEVDRKDTPIEGLHVHASFNSASADTMVRLVERLIAVLGTRLGRLRWLNLGGGYRFEHAAAMEQFLRAIAPLGEWPHLELVFEPGQGVVGSAGRLVTSVIDRFQSDGREIAVLDTAVNHLPRIFEYQLQPLVAEACADGAHEYLLAGASCLAGDLFGLHRFARPLTIGSRINIIDVGAYMLVKASRFNGINLPSIYARGGSQGLTLLKSYDYDAYRNYWS